MMKKIKYIHLLILIAPLISLQLLAQKPALYEVRRMPFNNNGFNNISPVIVKDGIVFCSDRRFSALKDRTSFDGRRLYNIYLAAKKDSVSFYRPVELRSERTNKFNNGPLCLGPDGKTVYFTSEVETGKMADNKNFKNHSGIFIADLSGTDLLSIRPFKYNNLQYDVGQPSVSKDGKYIYFASDMPGGSGGSDLYYCEFVNGDWSSPVNLGPKINSPGVENYPCIHSSGKLYFTSDRPGGFGNLDVYSTTLTDRVWDDPYLLPEPVNSSSDDFALVAEPDLQKGYFSSNRGKEDDIYEFRSTIIRKVSCDTLQENNYCYRFFEVNAVKYDTLPFRYEWKFGDGTVDSGADVIHCYKDPGTYLVQLDAVNKITKEVFYNEKSETVVVTEIVQPYISAPDRIGTGQSIALSADSTNLPGWNITQYYWNFGDETVDTGKDVNKSYLKPGTYNIQLIITGVPEPGAAPGDACISKNIIVFRRP